jgi:type IV pilus assembly protein PilC
VYMIIGVAVGGVAFRYWVRTEDGSRLFMSALLATPLVGPLLLQSAMERFSSNLALLLRAGMPLLEALYALEGTFHGNRPIRDCLSIVQGRVASGGRVADALKQAGLFTPMVVNLVAVGEESGELPKVLEHLGEFYKQKVNALVERVTSMIEPVIILGMGITVAVILTAIYLPMFSMGGAVG